MAIGTKKLVYDIQDYEDNSHLSKEIEEVLEHPEALDWVENDHNIDGDCID